jgi:hypothetical protein
MWRTALHCDTATRRAESASADAGPAHVGDISKKVYNFTTGMPVSQIVRRSGRRRCMDSNTSKLVPATMATVDR